jgi:heptosyltransferase-3
LSDSKSWDLHLSDGEKARAARALRSLRATPFVVLAISPKKIASDWGVENWKALMPPLHQELRRHAAVFIGAKEDRSASDHVAQQWPGRSINLCGELSPRESAAVIRHADLFLGPDSGPMHLAASVGTPCVSLFAAIQRPGIWFPFGDLHEVIYHQTECFGCNLEICNIEKRKCILSISVDEVVSAVRRVRGRNLKRRNPRLRDRFAKESGFQGSLKVARSGSQT